jgi:hypothetical protein
MTFSESERRAPNLPFTNRAEEKLSRNTAESAVIESQPALPDLLYLSGSCVLHNTHILTISEETSLASGSFPSNRTVSRLFFKIKFRITKNKNKNEYYRKSEISGRNLILETAYRYQLY